MKKFFQKIRQNFETYRSIRSEEKELYTEQKKPPSSMYRNSYKNNTIHSNTILYESYAGRGMICNPYGIFRAFLNRPDFLQYEHYWIIDDMNDNLWNIERYKEYNNIHFIQYRSPEYYDCLTFCQYLITNVAFPTPLTPISGQIYINTWHGIPLKTLGFDIPNGNISSRNTLRNFSMCDYLISPSPFMTEIYKTAFRLHHIYNGLILEEGQPRNDLLFHSSSEEVLEKLRAAGVSLSKDKKIILYAPTWRGTKYEEPDTDLTLYKRFLELFEHQINMEEYQILIKPHQIVYKYMQKNNSIPGKLVPASIDANELLAVTDVLISDFSSIFFDYLITERPILFFIPDLEEYKYARGLYHSVDHLPGPVTDKLEELPDMVKNLSVIQKSYKQKYMNLKKWACPNDDGNVCNRLLDRILSSNNPDSSVSDSSSDKITLAIYGGYMDDAHISTSLLTLLNAINYERYDITLLVTLRDDQSNASIISKLNPAIRVLTYLGPYNSDLKENIQYRTFKNSSLSWKFREHSFPKSLFHDEALRIFGNLSFDYAIDFVGNNLFFSCVFLYVSAKKHYIWQHSNMKALHKKFPELELDLIFSLYPQYDKIISSDSFLMEQNKKSQLAKHISAKYTYLPNIFFPITEQKENSPTIKIGDNVFFIKHIQKTSGKEKDFYLIPFPANKKLFVTVANFTPEENLILLVRAFGKLNDPDICLYMIGNGPQKQRLEKEIKKLKLEHNIILTGILDHPISLIKLCSCFVLSTKIHGLTAYALQARSYGLSLIHENNTDDLYKKLMEFIHGDLKQDIFHCESYLDKHHKQFESLFPQIFDKE